VVASAAVASAVSSTWFDPSESVLDAELQRSLLKRLHATPPPLPPLVYARTFGTDGDMDDDGDGSVEHYSHSHSLSYSAPANSMLGRLTCEAESLPILLRIQPIGYVLFGSILQLLFVFLFHFSAFFHIPSTPLMGFYPQHARRSRGRNGRGVVARARAGSRVQIRRGHCAAGGIVGWRHQGI
jgi:hypothetical protein